MKPPILTPIKLEDAISKGILEHREIYVCRIKDQYDGKTSYCNSEFQFWYDHFEGLSKHQIVDYVYLPQEDIQTQPSINKEVIEKLNEAFLPKNIECDGGCCMGCWKDVVNGAIKMLEGQLNEKDTINQG